MRIVEQNSNTHSDDNKAEPQLLYKYYKFDEDHPEYTEEIFTKNKIYLPSPKEFNDPFDSKVGLIYDATKKEWKQYLLQVYKRRRPDLTRKQRFAEVDQIIKKGLYKEIPDNLGYSFLDQMGVFCMSAKKNDILMWSHYSTSHAGFCLEFNATTEFFGRSQKIIYKQNYPAVNFFRSSQQAKTEASLLTKAIFWEYEQEWRIIEHNKGPGVYTFPRELLTGVILGCQITAENKEKIHKWCNKREHRPILYETRVKKKEFGLDIVAIDY